MSVSVQYDLKVRVKMSPQVISSAGMVRDLVESAIRGKIEDNGFDLEVEVTVDSPWDKNDPEPLSSTETEH